MNIEYQLLHPVTGEGPYSGLYKTDTAKFSSETSWNDIMNHFFRESENARVPGCLQFVCCCGCELFFLGGIPETGVNACQCKDCGNEIVFRKQQVTSNYQSNRPPLIGYKQRSGNIYSVHWPMYDIFTVGHTVEINGKKYCRRAQNFSIASGDDCCRLFGKKENSEITISCFINYDYSYQSPV
jgi:hypothetical protein